MIEIENKILLNKIISLIEETREKAIRSVDHYRTTMYWNIGKYIFEEEQGGKDRAEYGKYIVKYLSSNLEPSFGSGFSKRQLYLFIQFYKAFPIVHTLYAQLSWSQYKLYLPSEQQLLLAIEKELEKIKG
jgi:hypothetical protein